MRITILLLSIVSSFFASAQSADELAVRRLLDTQVQAWNRGDITGFMDGYWKSDSLTFIGKTGVHYGWQPTLDNYKKGYPDTVAMGKLSFHILQVKRLSFQYFYIIGKWKLQRSIGDLEGHYDLLLKKIKGKWVIVSDHSS
jgi:hypothetical protein